MKFSNQDEYLNNIIDTEKLLDNPCNKCDGDCCGPVPFKVSELEFIFKKYCRVPEFKKRFKATPNTNISQKLISIKRLFGGEVPGDEGLIVQFQKKNEYLKNGIKPGSCIFKRDEAIGTDHCMIYEDRPLICKAYGYESCKCPYAGLKEQPTGFVKDKLVDSAMDYRQKTMVQSFMKNLKDKEPKEDLSKVYETFGKSTKRNNNQYQGKVYVN